MNQNDYVLITSAKNEEKFIGMTIESIINQTILPRKWIIISDGSTDRTDDIIKKYAFQHDFIKYIRKDEIKEHDFGSKVKSFQMGVNLLTNEKYSFIGNLDADMTLDHDYYEKILKQFKHNPNLGIAGGTVYEKYDGKCFTYDHALNSVAGAVQLFRKECFDDVGGYLSLSMGGEDAAAEIKARMHGWEVQKYFDIHVFENRCTGFNNRSILKTRYKQGIIFYTLGYHPLFYICKCLRRLSDWPYIVGSLLMLYGYFRMYLRKSTFLVSDDIRNYLRSEQINKIKSIFWLKSLT